VEGSIWDVFYDEKRALLRVQVTGKNKKDIVYNYLEIPYAIYLRVMALHKKSLDSPEPFILYGAIWKILRPYKFEKRG